MARAATQCYCRPRSSQFLQSAPIDGVIYHSARSNWWQWLCLSLPPNPAMILFSYSYSVFGNGNCSSSSTAAVDKSQRNTILMWASKAEKNKLWLRIKSHGCCCHYNGIKSVVLFRQFKCTHTHQPFLFSLFVCLQTLITKNPESVTPALAANICASKSSRNSNWRSLCFTSLEERSLICRLLWTPAAATIEKQRR